MAKASDIRAKALELGYEECGIIHISEVNDYILILQNRMANFPENQAFLERLYRFVNLEIKFPWAKSIIICVRKYGKYYIPKNLQGVIAKYYLVDGRTDENSSDYKASIQFESYLHELNLQTITERKFGITALRWAALKAGLGTIRNNNFFYTEKSGSWVYLEAWLINKKMELKHEYTPKKCPVNCDKCIKICPTKSLNDHFSMNKSACVSNLTTFEGFDLLNNPHNFETGNWIYGCDACQDICPFNNKKWIEEEDFPNLNELSKYISLENIIKMDYDWLEKILSKKFFYIPKEKIYKWKINALNAIINNFDEKYLPCINKLCNDNNDIVRNMAIWITENEKA